MVSVDKREIKVHCLFGEVRRSSSVTLPLGPVLQLRFINALRNDSGSHTGSKIHDDRYLPE